MGGEYLARLLSVDGVLIRQAMVPMPVKPTLSVSMLVNSWADGGDMGTVDFEKRVVEGLDTDCPVATYQEIRG